MSEDTRSLSDIIDSYKKLRDKVPNTCPQYDFQGSSGDIDYYKNRYTGRMIKIERTTTK